MMKRFVMVPYEQFIKKEKLENNKMSDEITATATPPTSAVGNDDVDQAHNDSAGGDDRINKSMQSQNNDDRINESIQSQNNAPGVTADEGAYQIEPEALQSDDMSPSDTEVTTKNEIDQGQNKPAKKQNKQKNSDNPFDITGLLEEGIDQSSTRIKKRGNNELQGKFWIRT